MPRIAHLPNGTQLAFPDDTPDEHMDAQVQAHMGVPPPEQMPAPEEIMMQATQQLAQLVQQVTQAVGAVAQLAGAIAQGQQQMTHMVSQLMAQMGGVAEQTGQSNQIALKGLQLHAAAADQHTAALGAMKQSFDQGHAAMVKAVTAPKKIVTDKAGKPIGTTTDMSEQET
jgi:hypothetical protein